MCSWLSAVGSRRWKVAPWPGWVSRVIWPPGAAVREAAIARPSPVPLADRIGPRLQLSLGPCIIGAGLAMLTFSTSGSSYLTNVLPAVVVLGFGLAITVAPLTTTAMSSAPARHAGIASAINNDLARFGGLLAVAVLPCAGGHHRPGLPAAGRARRRIQDRRAHLGRAARCGHDHQPPHGPPASWGTHVRRMPAFRALPRK